MSIVTSPPLGELLFASQGEFFSEYVGNLQQNVGTGCPKFPGRKGFPASLPGMLSVPPVQDSFQVRGNTMVRCNPTRRDARVYGHTTTAMHNIE